MASSRIFVRGLPPTISEHEFKTHFAAKGNITDTKLIPSRRIGYVGFKTPEDAMTAVKYFNRSFIRMSKIAVEIAKPVADAELPTSRKAQREQAIEAKRVERERVATLEAERLSSKRKRVEVDGEDAKLKEYLELMQPASKPKQWATKNDLVTIDAEINQPLSVDVPAAESDDEYELVPKKRTRHEDVTTPAAPAAQAVVANTPPQSSEEESPIVTVSEAPNVAVEAQAGSFGDDDWLRSRTSRLLDIMDPEELPTQSARQVESSTATKLRAAIVGVAPTAHDEAPSPSLAHAGDPPVSFVKGEAESTVPEALTSISIEDVDGTIEAIKSTGRLFVRNLPYSATEDDLRDHFAKFGSLEEVHLPLDAAQVSKGFCFVQFNDSAAAADAFHNLDGETFQGRLLHVLPAAGKRETKHDEYAIAQLPLKKQKEIKRKQDAATKQFNWNSLYMSQDAVNSSIANRLGVSKSEMLDPTSADAGVKQAIAETSIIQETKSYFAKNGVDLNAFKRKERGDVAILAKNFPYGTSLEELRTMFEEYGQVLRVLMPPSGTIAIVEFAQAPEARAAFAKLAYKRMRNTMLLLEKAPKDLFTHKADDINVVAESVGGLDAKVSASDLLEGEAGETSTLFVRNLNFSTTSEKLTELFKPLDGFLSAKVKTKTDPKKPGQILSMGFGFLEFTTKAQANTALKAMDGYSLEGHKLLIKASHRALDAAEERKKEDRAKKMAGKHTKISIKNLPFEATKKDVRTLFGTYGKLKSVRMPKKFDNTNRGFAFADFVTSREAENALESLKDTHLLGRRLVLEFAAEDVLDAEEEIAKMQEKVGKQVSKVELQKLVGGGRQRFTIDGAEDE